MKRRHPALSWSQHAIAQIGHDFVHPSLSSTMIPTTSTPPVCSNRTREDHQTQLLAKASTYPSFQNLIHPQAELLVGECIGACLSHQSFLQLHSLIPSHFELSFLQFQSSPCYPLSISLNFDFPPSNFRFKP